ncbi:hypothetical protein B0H17DRAFT_1152856 [Mycena rosella]|uniref:Uncharacterized protein n=1 Tax=Mycena rosella TaxID=1033263 RepID=A0AAD7BAK6_MYCRO|nr:hypothetical protein B0H17DRAFT_1152856 [Mycena rosella]
MTTVPTDAAHTTTGTTDTRTAPDASPIASNPVNAHTVPAASSFVPAITPTSFIAYTPGAALANHLNTGLQKCKAMEDPVGSAPLKKTHQLHSNKGTKRGAEGLQWHRAVLGKVLHTKKQIHTPQNDPGGTRGPGGPDCCTQGHMHCCCSYGAAPPELYYDIGLEGCIIHDIAEPTERGATVLMESVDTLMVAQRAGDIDAMMGMVMAMTVVMVTLMKAIMMGSS